MNFIGDIVQTAGMMLMSKFESDAYMNEQIRHNRAVEKLEKAQFNYQIMMDRAQRAEELLNRREEKASANDRESLRDLIAVKELRKPSLDNYYEMLDTLKGYVAVVVLGTGSLVGLVSSKFYF